MPRTQSRVALLAGAADAVAVVVFAAVGRLSHGEADDLLGLIGTAAPFGVGLVAAWATPVVMVETHAMGESAHVGQQPARIAAGGNRI